jgi:hypothetical protein
MLLTGQYLQVVLGTVLVVAAVTKLHRPAASARFASHLGVSGRLAHASAIALGGLELGLGAAAAALVAPVAAAWACVALFAAFAGLVLATRHRDRPPCGCFGALDTAEATPVQDLRAVALLVIAVGSAVMIGSGPAPAAETRLALTAEGVATGIASVMASVMAQRIAIRLSRAPAP